jgi:hypothetical protein
MSIVDDLQDYQGKFENFREILIIGSGFSGILVFCNFYLF